MLINTLSKEPTKILITVFSWNESLSFHLRIKSFRNDSIPFYDQEESNIFINLIFLSIVILTQ